MSSKIPLRQTSCTHTEKKIYKQYDLNIPAVPFNPVFIPETYPSRNLVEPWIVESRVQINALNILHSENRKKYHKYHKLMKQKEQMGKSTLPLYYVLFKFELFLYEILTLTQIYVKIPQHSLSGSPELLRSSMRQKTVKMYDRDNLLPECRCSILEASPPANLKSPVYSTFP